jgi:hypothetical protein
MVGNINSFRFLDPVTKQVIKAWIRREPVRDIPWTTLSKPLTQAKVALLSSAGLGRPGGGGFDQEGERRNPWWGDPRILPLPSTTGTGDVEVQHLHVHPKPPSKDLDCVLPLRRLEELVAAGSVGAMAETHYTLLPRLLMGRLPDG